MNKSSFKPLVLVASICVGLSPLIAAHAQGYPDKPIRIVLPYPPGGAVDNTVRNLLPGLQKELGQPLVVDNKPGGGAQIAAAAVLSAPADGYTIFALEIGVLTINPTLYKDIRYGLKDFEPVTPLIRAPMVMFASSTDKVSSVDALNKLMASGDQISYGSMGAGSGSHILGHLLKKSQASSNLIHVPYKGAAPAIQAVMANEVDIMFDGVPNVLTLARSGRVKPIALAASQRSPYFPDTPTMAELGKPNIAMDLAVGVVVKKGTPDAIVKKVHDAFVAAIDDPATLKKFTDLGYSRSAMTPTEYGRYISSEMERLRPVVIDSGATVE